MAGLIAKGGLEPSKQPKETCEAIFKMYESEGKPFTAPTCAKLPVLAKQKLLAGTVPDSGLSLEEERVEVLIQLGQK